MGMKTLMINTLSELDKVAEEFIRLTRGHKRFAFYGPMGSGKTTFIKAVCHAMGAVDVVTSPSFALINEYRSGEGTMFYHIDLYRIESVEELYDIGYEEYFFSDAWCFIEWPEKAEMLLPPDAISVRMEDAGEKSRLVHIDI
ncbi:MAG: tRNA (adenosine(37)-N6)-threonylcarbamoyltransferase complex ATPase subunit type 1 TsaE [Bacteroidales bacterium]|nr:tRNA (adenosine(37)-N6)-threonylcarbamoyltransferase complex ATPase subunit type 1 TsaE [Bacteroidales bacterium]